MLQYVHLLVANLVCLLSAREVAHSGFNRAFLPAEAGNQVDERSESETKD